MEELLEKNTCRICLTKQDTVFSLFRKRKGISPCENVTKLGFKIEATDTGPTCICCQCLTELETTLVFLEKCKKSSEILFARYGQRITVDENQKSKVHQDTSEFEVDDKIIDDAPHVVEYTPVERALHDDVKSSVYTQCVAEDRCPDCGSRRRCRHWAPPTAHACPVCQKVFKRKFNLRLHIKRHRGEHDYTCRTCGAAAVTLWLAQRHCVPRKRLSCPVPGCTKTYTTRTNLSTHIRAHSGDRPFECSDCGKKFTSKNTLSDHMRIHTGVKPYVCPVCGKQFTTNKLSAHMWSHAPHPRPPRAPPPRAPPPAACALCPARYRHSQSLRKHIRKHHTQISGSADDTSNVSKQIDGEI